MCRNDLTVFTERLFLLIPHVHIGASHLGSVLEHPLLLWRGLLMLEMALLSL